MLFEVSNVCWDLLAAQRAVFEISIFSRQSQVTFNVFEASIDIQDACDVEVRHELLKHTLLFKILVQNEKIKISLSFLNEKKGAGR